MQKWLKIEFDKLKTDSIYRKEVLKVLEKNSVAVRESLILKYLEFNNKSTQAPPEARLEAFFAYCAQNELILPDFVGTAFPFLNLSNLVKFLNNKQLLKKLKVIEERFQGFSSFSNPLPPRLPKRFDERQIKNIKSNINTLIKSVDCLIKSQSELVIDHIAVQNIRDTSNNFLIF